MADLAGLERKLKTIDDLQSVVKTMKALAAVNIRQYEQSAESLEAYNVTVERGLQAALISRPEGLGAGWRKGPAGPLGAVVFGSDQGMAGRLNEEIVEYAEGAIKDLEKNRDRIHVLAVGDRARMLLEDRGLPVDGYLAVPTSPTGLNHGVQETLMRLDAWRENFGTTRIELFFNRRVSGASFEPMQVRLSPVDQAWLAELKKRPWPGPSLPFSNMNRDDLLAGLIRQFMFVSLFRAFAQSLASENASRLAAMQSAEKNIEEQQAEVRNQYHQQRQGAITEELLDLAAGFSALEKER